MSLSSKEELELLQLLELEQKYQKEQELKQNLSRIWNDEEYYITNFVYIEDKTSPEGISLFHLWPEQQRALSMLQKEQFVIALKARQLGLTWLVIVDTLFNMMRVKNYTAIAISKRDDPDAIELSLRMQLVLRHLPDWLIRPKSQGKGWEGLTWSANDHEVYIYRPDGEPSRFMTLPASPDTAHSFTANRVILDEWALHPFAYDIWTGAYPTMNRAGFSGQVIGLSTGRRNTLFEEIWNLAKQGINRFKTIFLSWRADPRRTQQWYEQTQIDLPNTWRSQYPEREEDAFAVGEGAFFAEWDDLTHVFADHWVPPKGWSIIGGYDAGFAAPACFKWYAITPDGRLKCFREYYPTRVIDRDQAREIIRRSCYDDGNAQDVVIRFRNNRHDWEEETIHVEGTPFEMEYIAADTDAWVPERGSGESTAEVFIKYGLPMMQATKNLENGWRRLHEWLKPMDGPDGNRTALLTFTRDCANTIRTYPSCEQSEANAEDISKKTEHHAQDVDRYVVMSRPAPATAKPKTPEEEYLETLNKDSAEYQIKKKMLDVMQGRNRRDKTVRVDQYMQGQIRRR
jgi:hypothetical protein